MLRYIKCSEVELNDLVTVFNTGFSDYVIQLKMTEEILNSRFLNIEQNQLENSFIAYDDQKPVGLILGGYKIYEGIKTLRCGTLCVDPNYRKLGVATKLYELHKQLAIEKGCQRLYLEVIQENDKAIRFYLKHGYSIINDLEYYSHLNPQILNSSIPNEVMIQESNLEHLEIFHQNNIKTHLNWQNDFDYMRFFSQLKHYKLMIKEAVIGLISILPQGKIFYVWIEPKYHKLGYGKSLLAYVVNQFSLTKLSISFPKDIDMISFLTHVGFTKDSISQYEMELKLG